MNRREFIASAGAGAAAMALPETVLAQPPAKVPHVIVLNNGYTEQLRQALFQGLADYGYADGRNIAVEFVNAPSIADVPAYAAMAVAKKPDLIWTLSSRAPQVLKELTSNIPVVFTYVQDPVAIGVVSNYSRPDGNLTGNMLAGIDYTTKQVAIIRETLPTISRLAVLGLPADPPYPAMLSRTQAAAKALNIEILLFETKEGEDLAPAFDQMSAHGAQAIYVIVAQYLIGIDTRIATFALQHRLPSFMNTQSVPNGIMVGFSSNVGDVVRRSASYVDAILKGAKPSALPIDQPTKFDLVLNQKTASALGVTFPQSLLYQASEVIS